jgi:hypothetical protein
MLAAMTHAIKAESRYQSAMRKAPRPAAETCALGGVTRTAAQASSISGGYIGDTLGLDVCVAVSAVPI